MSAQDDFTRTFIWVLSLLVLFTMVVMLVARSVGMDENSGSMADEDIDMRTKPYGSVNVAVADEAAVEEVQAEVAVAVKAVEKPAAVEAAPAPAPVAAPAAQPMAAAEPAIDARSLYGACAGCHDYGVMGAPRPGDAMAWEPRLLNGFDALVQSAINGKGGMPAKGGRADFTDQQIAALVKYMSGN